jgi:peptidyl-prolyl cis-trans isomerase C
MNPRLALAGCTAVLLVLTGCDQLGNQAPTPAETNAAFEAFVKAAARKSAAELTPDELTQAVDQYIGMQVAAEAATKAGLDKDPQVKSQIALGRTNVLSESLLQKHLESSPITDAEIQAEYDAQVAKAPGEYSARHILVDDKALAEAIIKKLEAGGDFAALAKEYSKDGSAKNGGDLGWFNAQSMVQPFSEAVAKLEKGKYTLTPVETQFGWHVIQLDDTRAASLPPLDQVKDRVEQLVQRTKITEYLKTLRAESTIDAEKMTAALTAYATTPKEEAKDAATGAAAEPTGAPAVSAPQDAPAEAPKP